MTLGGLALAVGILVDDATVTIESINWHLEQGKDVETAILDGASQIVVPAFVSLLCICIVFVPMFFLSGVSRFLFVPMAESVMFAMIFSFLLSRTLVPTMAKYLLRPHAAHGDAHVDVIEQPPSRNPLVRFQHAFEAGFVRLRTGYHDLLALAIEHRKVFVAGFLGFVAVSFLLAPFLGAPPRELLGRALLDNATLNKGTAFTAEERKRYDLEGLLPASIETLDRQVERVRRHLEAKPTDLERYIYLIGLADRNETLFYRTLMSDPARFVPIVYDPTVADACLAFGHVYRRARGMYITRLMKGRIAEVLRNWPTRDVRFICVSTGGRILGLGDIGANGMGIPIGKLQLYTACAAVPPACMLPVLLDVGTTNAQLRADPLYLGLREPPPPEEELDALTEEFVNAVQEVFPGLLHPFRGLERDRRNPDIEALSGQGAVLQRRHPGHRERGTRRPHDRAADPR